jgi:propanol-preferring alcohol dehydrogenase
VQAMLLDRVQAISANSAPLRLAELPVPNVGAGEVLVQVSACGVCHTELDEIEGRLAVPQLPIILGQQVVGRVVQIGEQVIDWQPGERVGVAWIIGACGKCAWCRSDRENLCPHFQATGRDRHGGYAQFMTAPAAFVHSIPDVFTDAEAAPLLCAGAIGYRSLRLLKLQDGQRLGLTGFGSSARLVLRMVRWKFPTSEVFVFARSPAEREAALELGAAWAGDTNDPPPAPLDAILDTTPAWTPVVAALAHLAPGGRLVINAIRKEPADHEALLSLDYERHLWHEKEVQSVANVTRRDVREFLELAAAMRLTPQIEEYPLRDANAALTQLKTRPVMAAKVLRVAN